MLVPARTTQTAGQRFLLAVITAYRWTLSGLLGGHCRFYPSCSYYAAQAVREHGALRGSWLSAGRVLRCHPWSRGGADPVPSGRSCRDREDHNE
jgi:putative membrane protein insertion efficiency factor